MNSAILRQKHSGQRQTVIPLSLLRLLPAISLHISLHAHQRRDHLLRQQADQLLPLLQKFPQITRRLPFQLISPRRIPQLIPPAIQRTSPQISPQTSRQLDQPTILLIHQQRLHPQTAQRMHQLYFLRINPLSILQQSRFQAANQLTSQRLSPHIIQQRLSRPTCLPPSLQ